MAKEAIKDKRGLTLGYVETFLNGTAKVYDKQHRRIGEIKPQGNQLIAYDASFRRIAYWKETSNETYDKMGRRIGKGNILIELYFQ